MRRLVLFCLIFGVPLAAHAELVTVDAHEIDRCLGRVPETPMQCVGVGANLCVLSGGDELDLTAPCMQAEIELWEAWLNSAYAGALQAAEARELADPTREKGTLTTALRDMQQAWIVYRDATCAHAAAAFDDAASDDDATDCLLSETARQTFELRRLNALYRTK